MFVKGCGWFHRPGEVPVGLACYVALEAGRISLGFSLGGATGDVHAGAGAAAHTGERDGVDGAVEGAAGAAVEPAPDGLTTTSPVVVRGMPRIARLHAPGVYLTLHGR